MNASGRARVEFDTVDLSILYNTGLKGISAVAGKTQFDNTSTATDNKGKSQLVGTWTEFRKFFGEEIADSIFPTLCKRALQAGTRLRIKTIHHYTDTADASTLVGVRATGSIYTFDFTANSVGLHGNGITVAIAAARSGNGIDMTISLAGFPELTKTIYDVTGADEANLLKINAAQKIVTVVEGAEAEGEILTTSLGAAGTGYTVSDVLTVGGAGTGATITVNTIGGSGEIATYTLTTGGINYVAAAGVALTGGTGTGGTLNILTANTIDTIPTSVTLTGGDEDRTLIDKNDYIGDLTGGTGIHGFDDDTDFVRVSCPEMCDPDIDDAMGQYVNSRGGDCRYILRTPVGIDGNTAIAYRMRTDFWAGMGSVIDDNLGSMTYGGIEVANTRLGVGTQILPLIGDYLGNAGLKDNRSKEWFTTAGPKRGRLKGVISVEYNLGSPARGTEFDSVCNAGINPVINDGTYGPVIWNNASLQRAQTLLAAEEVSELLVYLRRNVGPIARGELFDPNDPLTWGNIFKKANPILKMVKDGRGLWDYLYQGDQYVEDISKCKVNTPENIDAGQYLVNLWLKPKRGMKWIGITMIVTNSGVDFAQAQGQPL